MIIVCIAMGRHMRKFILAVTAIAFTASAIPVPANAQVPPICWRILVTVLVTTCKKLADGTTSCQKEPKEQYKTVCKPSSGGGGGTLTPPAAK